MSYQIFFSFFDVESLLGFATNSGPPCIVIIGRLFLEYCERFDHFGDYKKFVKSIADRNKRLVTLVSRLNLKMKKTGKPICKKYEKRWFSLYNFAMLLYRIAANGR